MIKNLDDLIDWANSHQEEHEDNKIGGKL